MRTAAEHVNQYRQVRLHIDCPNAREAIASDMRMIVSRVAGDDVDMPVEQNPEAYRARLTDVCQQTVGTGTLKVLDGEAAQLCSNNGERGSERRCVVGVGTQFNELAGKGEWIGHVDLGACVVYFSMIRLDWSTVCLQCAKGAAPMVTPQAAANRQCGGTSAQCIVTQIRIITHRCAIRCGENTCLYDISIDTRE